MVIEDIKQRKQIGIERYGTPLQAFNGRDALQDAYEEAIDLCMYLKQLIVERETMDSNIYQDATFQTQIYADAANEFIAQIIAAHETDNIALLNECRDMLSLMYCVGKLNGEAGELAELVFKAFRGDGIITDSVKDRGFYELGDVSWYVARISDLLGHRLGEVLHANIEKLRDRKKRDVIHGYGDDR